MKKAILTLLLFAGFYGFSQTSLYENPNFNEIAESHEIIAIMPFKTKVKLRPRQMKKTTPEEIEKLQEFEGYAIQKSMYDWFMKRKKRGALKIEVQDVDMTNELLANNGVGYDNFDQYTPQELAGALAVDAIIMGDFLTNRPMSNAASITMNFLIGFGNSNTATIDLFIYNAADGELLVNYNKGIGGSAGSNTDQLINVLMRKASRRIAYTNSD